MTKKIDRRRIYGIMLDTETVGDVKEKSSIFFYDLGFSVIDTKGNVYESFSFVNADVFLDMADLMKSAYFANKIPQYYEDLEQGKRILSTTYGIRKKIHEICEEYGCKFIVAHNMRFDYNSCQNTQRYITKSKYRYFFPKDLEIWDTLAMARQVVAKKPSYIAFCQENGYTTKNNKPRLTAEILYRFISGDLDFEESHTGLEDVEIESVIFRYCMRQHKPMNKKCFKD